MLPSFVLSLLYLTVLSFGGQMITYLISAGYNSFIIALVRTVSVVFELSSTWIAPRLMKRILPARVGMWFLGWQMLWLGAAVVFFWAEPRPIVAASGLVAGTIFSRIGLWGYDLCAQFIVQEVRWNLKSLYWSVSNMIQGSARQISRFFLLHRGFITKRLRADFLRIHHHLVTTNPISVSGFDECRCNVSIRIPIWQISQTKKETSPTYARVHST